MDLDMDVDMDVDHSFRSPSPAQAPPTPAAPGPRASALQKLYADAVNHIIKTCSYSNFASCFPTPATQVPGSVKLLHEQFTDKLGESMRKEFDSILEERNVVLSLNELDRLIEDAKRRKPNTSAQEGRPVPAHTLPAKQLYISHLAPTLQIYEAQMKAREEGLGEENQALIEKIMQQRKDIQNLVDGLEGVVRDLNGSVAAMKPEEMDALREASRDVDEGMR